MCATGIVRSLSNFGVFVDLGGADGLIHISELAWFPVAPSQRGGEGRAAGRGQGAAHRQAARAHRPEPEARAARSVEHTPRGLYNVGELVEAVVTRVTDFGAFVRLRTGVEGLLHVSEMADIRPDHPQSLVAPGDLLLLRVLRIEPDRRRIGLSLRQVSETEWAEWAASYREKQRAEAQSSG